MCRVRHDNVQRRYSVIYADPPWAYNDKNANGNRGAACKYPVLKPRDIAGLPVGKIMADDCAVFLWATMPMLPEALGVLDGWGAKFKTVAFVWVKLRRGFVQGESFDFEHDTFFGTGHWTRANAELVLLGTRGRPKVVDRAVRQVILARPMGHSEKPAEVRKRIVWLMGDVPRIELFARERAPGWDATGLDLDGLDVRDFLAARSSRRFVDES